MYEIFDEYCWTKTKKVITKDKHHVPGLGNFTYWNHTSTTAPSPMHYHSDIIEVHCMIKGTRYTQMEKGGNLTRHITTGNQAFITFPFELHSNGNKPQAPCEFYAFQIITSDPYNMLGLNREYSYMLYNQLMSLMKQEHRHLKLGVTHLKNLQSAFTFFSELNEESITIGVSFLNCFLYNLQFLTPIPGTLVQDIDEHIKKAILYLNENIQESLQLIDLAEISGYSLSHFKVRFKEEIGVTPAEYISLQKLEIAKRELVETDRSITDLAYYLGFSSSNYFSAVFKKLMGCTPRDYRNYYGIRQQQASGRSAHTTSVKNSSGDTFPFFISGKLQPGASARSQNAGDI